MDKCKYFALAFLMCSSVAAAQEHFVGQKNKAFTEKNIIVKIGDKVTFSNKDPFFHNIYSLSEGNAFDLGSYPKGGKRSIIIENKGVVQVECAIHPNMKMTVTVEP
jgi:plastocyanin